jgi:hypothetical protein
MIVPRVKKAWSMDLVLRERKRNNKWLIKFNSACYNASLQCGVHKLLDLLATAISTALRHAHPPQPADTYELNE